MDQRHQIGLYYYFDKSWLGGLYYAQNLVMALNTLADEKKPCINDKLSLCKEDYH